jgi:hypothetical protein
MQLNPTFTVTHMVELLLRPVGPSRLDDLREVRLWLEREIGEAAQQRLVEQSKAPSQETQGDPHA